jgi:hypothetical protein
MFKGESDKRIVKEDPDEDYEADNYEDDQESENDEKREN